MTDEAILICVDPIHNLSAWRIYKVRHMVIWFISYLPYHSHIFICTLVCLCSPRGLAGQRSWLPLCPGRPRGHTGIHGHHREHGSLRSGLWCTRFSCAGTATVTPTNRASVPKKSSCIFSLRSVCKGHRKDFINSFCPRKKRITNTSIHTKSLCFAMNMSIYYQCLIQFNDTA